MLDVQLAACPQLASPRSPGSPGARQGGGLLVAARRRLPSSVHAGIASGSAPALRHSAAAWRTRGSSSSPSDVPSKIPATSASRSARPPASSRSAATAAVSSASVSLRHRARWRASPKSPATSNRSADGRGSIMYSSIAADQGLLSLPRRLFSRRPQRLGQRLRRRLSSAVTRKGPPRAPTVSFGPCAEQAQRNRVYLVTAVLPTPPR